MPPQELAHNSPLTPMVQKRPQCGGSGAFLSTAKPARRNAGYPKRGWQTVGD